jgi:hypothetical protein
VVGFYVAVETATHKAVEFLALLLFRFPNVVIPNPVACFWRTAVRDLLAISSIPCPSQARTLGYFLPPLSEAHCLLAHLRYGHDDLGWFGQCRGLKLGQHPFPRRTGFSSGF